MPFGLNTTAILDVKIKIKHYQLVGISDEEVIASIRVLREMTVKIYQTINNF